VSIIEQFNLGGQVAVVTGAGRGIGEAIAVGLAEAGADVVVAARRTNEIERVAERIEALGRRALAVTCDVMDMSQVEALAQETEKAMGGLTCWVSNAGGADDRVARTLLEMPERQWDFQLNLNLKAVWSGNGPYAVAKSGVNNLTQTLAVELARYGIRVNGISPGPIPTEVFMEFLDLKEEDLPKMGERLNIPLGRLGAPEDISPAVVYLASQASSWMTGQTMVINGGS
jgi:NAD(P)-dependent dehydrogenase (short-subunit alcohol dehydrogenase family)